MQASNPTATRRVTTSRWECVAVRDLAWVIGSPPLVGMQETCALWPDAHWFQEQLERMIPVLDALDAGQWPGREEFAARQDQRLGAYFEFLVERWLELDERFELVARNLAVREPRTGGGRQTIGELDFIVRDHFDQQVEHWEVAVKFYLGGVPGSDGAWLGPGLRDRLDRKLARLINHQLVLSEGELVRETLARQGLMPDRTRAVVKGRLFYPRAVPLSPPRAGAHHHLRGWWLQEDAFASTFEGCDRRWRLVEGKDRLAERGAGRGLLSAAETAALLNANGGLEHPCLLAVIEGDQETSRGYVVPNNWRVPREVQQGDTE